MKTATRKKATKKTAPKKKQAARKSTGPTVFSRGDAGGARDAARNSFGAEFANKATDDLLLAIARTRGRREATFEMAGVAAAVPANAIVIEFTARETPQPEEASREVRGAAEALNRVSGEPKLTSTHLLRHARALAYRDAFYRQISPITAEIEKRAGALFSGGPRGMVARAAPSITEVCWLNETARTWTPATMLAEVAGDPAIDRIDLPRRLTAEIRVSGPTVGGPVFREKFSVDGKGIVVAVIDSEVDLKHPALRGRVSQKQNHTRELFGNPDSHATAVAGIIGARDSRFSGIAPGVTFLNYKVLATDENKNADDFGGSLAVQQALEDGAHIANCSWGAGPARDGTSREARACDRAWSLGLVIVKSAGNQGPGSGTMTTPADAAGIIVVAATDRRGKTVQSYSSRGPAKNNKRPHLAAPGGSMTEGITGCMLGGKFGSVGAGTSFAAPHVTALAALLLDRNGDLTPDQVREQLVAACQPFKKNDVNVSGAGLVSLASVKS